jgi:hypothetical protein
MRRSICRKTPVDTFSLLGKRGVQETRELRSANVEYPSISEELETSKEELQSINEGASNRNWEGADLGAVPQTRLRRPHPGKAIGPGNRYQGQ